MFRAKTSWRLWTTGGREGSGGHWMTQPVAFNGGHGVKCVTRCSFLIARLLVDRGCPLWSRTARDATTRGTRVGAVEGAFDGQRGGHNATVYNGGRPRRTHLAAVHRPALSMAGGFDDADCGRTVALAQRQRPPAAEHHFERGRKALQAHSKFGPPWQRKILP